MNPFKPTRIEWITFFTIMPFLGTTLTYLLFGWPADNPGKWTSSFPVVFIIGFISWYLHILSMHWLRIKFPEFRQTIFRLFLLAIIHLSLISFSMVVFFYGFDAVGFLDYKVDVEKFNIGIIIGFAITLVATTIWESEYIFNKWKESLAEKEMLEQLKLKNEFEALKSQVNPHFLFNCFNTLSSLINEDPDQAEKFLDEMSKVYRYLLKTNEDGLTPLKSEMKFMMSYFELLKTRYGNAIGITYNIDKKYEEYLLPSLTLQLLVENAVKHNIISKQAPLSINIQTGPGNILVVSNNLQRKLVKAPSNNIGLKNIRSKYELLKEDGFRVMEDDKNFTVILPLLWSKTLENKFAVLQ